MNILYNINDENVLKIDTLMRSRINISFITFNKFFSKQHRFTNVIIFIDDIKRFISRLIDAIIQKSQTFNNDNKRKRDRSNNFENEKDYKKFIA